MSFIITGADTYVPQVPSHPKHTLDEAANLFFVGARTVEITDAMRAKSDRRFKEMGNERQMQGRPDEVRRHRLQLGMWAEDALAMLCPGLEENPHLVARGWNKRDAPTQMPDLIHTETGTQYEIKVLDDPRYSDFGFYPKKFNPTMVENPHLVDYFVLARGTYDATHYTVKPIQIFPIGLIFDPVSRSPSPYVTVGARPDKFSGGKSLAFWEVRSQEAVTDGLAVVASYDIGPL